MYTTDDCMYFVSRFLILGFSLLFDRVVMQGLPNSRRSVSQYKLSYSANNQVYTPINNQVRPNESKNKSRSIQIFQL